MAKFSIGFLVGIALASAAFLLFDKFFDSPRVELMGNAGLPGAPEPLAAGTASKSSDAHGDAGSPSQASGVTSASTASLGADLRVEALTDEELKQIVANSSRAANELLRRATLADWASQPAPTQPITLPGDFDWLAVIPSNNHEEIQREPVDVTWAPMMETRLGLYVSLRPKITDTFGYPTINCRKTLCELAFVVPKSATAALSEQGVLNRGRLPLVLQRDISDFSKQPLADQFQFDPNVITYAANVQDGVATLLWFLRKKPE